MSAQTRMKTSQSYIARVEGGMVNPSTDAMERFAQATRTRRSSSNRTVRGESSSTGVVAPGSIPVSH
jgi:predicted transcriptional regulator